MALTQTAWRISVASLRGQGLHCWSLPDNANADEDIVLLFSSRSIGEAKQLYAVGSGTT